MCFTLKDKGSSATVLELKYLIRSCARVLKDSVTELLTLASEEEITGLPPFPTSELFGHRDSRMPAMV